MAKEIEKRFICKFVPKGLKPLDIKQGYVFHELDKQIRVRIINDAFGSICIKFTETIERDEFEYNIPLKDAQEIFDKCELKLTKIRYKTKIGKYTVDIDKYPTGLITAEVELDSKDDDFDLPDYLGEEVTGDYRYSNIHIAEQISSSNIDTIKKFNKF